MQTCCASLICACFSPFQAQAQECILEKSLVDSRKSTIVAKVAAQIVTYYEQCIKVLEKQSVEEIVGSAKVGM